MCFKVFKNTVLLFVLLTISCACGNDTKTLNKTSEIALKKVINKKKTDTLLTVGANRTKRYLSILKGKRIAVVANQTSVIYKNRIKNHLVTKNTKYVHLVDSLLKLGVNVKKVFAPEHGFRGIANAGELVKDSIDTKTGLLIISLYGKQKKPSQKHLKDIDLVVFDIQDVGVRFYTYISSLHYVMEACAEQNKPLLILDRPNPNGHYIDGPILQKKYSSFVGLHPVPVVHGMTIGEYAKMINGEGWLKNGIKCDLSVIKVKNYTHNIPYSLAIKPSPNLPNDKSINLYPSLCFFEGTNVSIGRGTDKPFQIIGVPFYHLEKHQLNFIPYPNEGAKYPKHEGKVCNGYDLSKTKTLNRLDLKWLIQFYKDNKIYAKENTFFNSFFTKLAGTKQLQRQIEFGLGESEIRATWQKGLKSYKKMRKPYLIYD